MKTSKPEKNWLVPTPSLDESGDQIFNSKGEKVMKLIQMAPGSFDNGTPQSFYFPTGHRHTGLFKGMRVILEERGFSASQLHRLKRECKNFHCPAGRTDCCMRRVLYSQPDFRNVKSVLENHCNQRGVEVLFLPKFHPELNPIEQCWGRAKWYYRQLPASSLEADLERNVVESLESIPITLMRRYATVIFVHVSTRLTSPSGSRTGPSDSWIYIGRASVIRKRHGPRSAIIVTAPSRHPGRRISRDSPSSLSAQFEYIIPFTYSNILVQNFLILYLNSTVCHRCVTVDVIGRK